MKFLKHSSLYFLLLLVFVDASCKRITHAVLNFTEVDENILLETNPESAAAAGLKLAKPYRVDDICLPSHVGLGAADITAGCLGFEKYLRAQCGSDVMYKRHNNPKVSEISGLAKARAQSGMVAGIWVIEAHGQEYAKQNANMIYTVDRSCGMEDMQYTGDLLRSIRNYDSSAIWLSACYSELKGDHVSDVGYSSQVFETSKVPYFTDGTTAPEYSLLHLVDTLCSAEAKSRDKNNDGYLDGAELGAPKQSKQFSTVVADSARKTLLPTEVLKSEIRGHVITAMQCIDRLGRKHRLAFRGDDKGAFAVTEEEVKDKFSKVGPLENKSIVGRIKDTQMLRIQFPGPDGEFPGPEEEVVTDKIRFSDNLFPGSFKIGNKMKSLEILKDCQPIIEIGALLEIEVHLKPVWEILPRGVQSAVPADFRLPLPVWKK